MEKMNRKPSEPDPHRSLKKLVHFALGYLRGAMYLLK